MKPIKCWHFLQNDRRLQWGAREVVEVGKTYTCEGKVVLYENGLQGSRKILDALGYALGSICCQVEIWGDVDEDDDRLFGRNRKVLKMIDATEILRKFARMCALDVIDLWKAPDVVIRYLKTGDESLRNAAEAATRNARNATRKAWDATRKAWNAARNARDVSWNMWDAARSMWDAAEAARDATRNRWDASRNAWDASQDAAQAASRDETRDAAGKAGDALWDKQNKRLTNMVLKKIKIEEDGVQIATEALGESDEGI